MRTSALIARIEESMERRDERFEQWMRERDERFEGWTQERDERFSQWMEDRDTRFQELMERQEASFERQAEAFDRQAIALDRQAEAFANDRAVMRSFIADIHAREEELSRRSEAVTGAMIDLAAEIRSWRTEGGRGGTVS